MLRFARARGGAAALEFAFAAPALLAFIFVMLNLGDLAVTYGVLQSGTATAARATALAAAADLANDNAATLVAPSTSCTALSETDLLQVFDSAIAPLLPPATSVASATTAPEIGPPALALSWTNAPVGTVSGSFLTVAASYVWTPLVNIGFPKIPLRAIAAAPVIGASATSDDGSAAASLVQC